jgi:hypothetical protein
VKLEQDVKSHDENQLLTRGELALIILAVLPIFLFFAGPVWEHPYQIDGAVYWSYAPIPVLVAFVSLRRHVLSLAGFLVNTITALSVKYMVTTGAAFLLWSVIEPPALAEAKIEESQPGKGTRRALSADDNAVEIFFDTRAIAPEKLELSNKEMLSPRSLDGSLHTLRARRQDGRIALNLPVIPGRGAQHVSLDGLSGRLELSCTVHPGEQHATLVIH